MKRYRVRFHLAKGDNYMKWQVFDKKRGTKKYYEPDAYSIQMLDCKLGNQPATAKRIFNGENKTVCAWVECENIAIWDADYSMKSYSIDDMTHYKYNPRKNPHWFTDTHDNMDGKKFNVMMTYGRKIYA